jgi:hypothetical protein
VLALDSDLHDAYVDAVTRREQARAWSNEHELLASAVELLHDIADQIRRGLPVLMVKKRSSGSQKSFRYPRPDWVKQPDEAVVVTPRELARRTGGGG